MIRAAAASAVLLAMTLPQSASAQKSSGSLADAYKREYAFLEAEKRALKKRIEDEKASAAKRIAAAKAEIGGLSGSVVAMASQAENVGELMLSAERDIGGLEEASDVVGDIAVRAKLAYDKAGLELPAADSDSRAEVLAQLRFIFESAPASLAKASSVRIETGTYFDSVGKEVKGQVVHIGNVAAYGLAEASPGVLAPAGEGKLKIWPSEGGGDAARAIAEGAGQAMVPIFLFESLEKGVEEQANKSLREFIDTGGVIGWVIVALGILVLLMALARLFLLVTATMGGRRTVNEVLAKIGSGDFKRAKEAAERATNSSGRVLSATLGHLGRDRPILEDVVAEAVLAEQPRLARFGAAILVVAAVSPLLGLLGTVTGMISTFDIITEFGTGNPKLLSGGISEALVTTELGLIVAIPALLIGHLLSGMAERARDNLDAAALAAINRAKGLDVSEPNGAATATAKALPEHA